ncbi:Transcription antitermination protein RfaH [termite gut metagenome]|uniref:Transcription antitermination protein RfaH n=1 Tax=termite gut metagenome TaxID=433724 RepID=A0A5J4S2Y1_9ZZZZ
MAAQQEFWFVTHTESKRELYIGDLLEKLHVVHYLPTYVVVRQTRHEQYQRIKVPIVNNLLFIKATEENFLALVKNKSYNLCYIKDSDTDLPFTVPDKQMNDFMYLMSRSSQKALILPENNVAQGDKVRILGGDFLGMEGEAIQTGGKTYITARIPKLLIAGIEISEDHWERLG